LTGAVIMADWLTSGGYDADELSAPWVPGFSPDYYRDRFGITPRPMQAKAEEIAREIEQPGIMIIESEMGSGKTEAALTIAEIFASRTERNGVYFALPTQATSDGLFGRFVKWAPNAAGDVRRIRLLHGRANLNAEYRAINKEHIKTSGNDEDAPADDWFAKSRKTKILDDFGVGTIDQLLLAGLKQKHVMLRHLGLANKVVIIDECHAYDAYMNVYLERVLTWLSEYRVPVIILSATLPESTRNAMIKAYTGVEPPPQPERRYPLITYSDTDGHGIEIKYGAIPQGEQKQVGFEYIEDPIAEPDKRIPDRKGVVGVIVNTVKRSQELYKALAELYGADNVRLLHSRFIASERAGKENELKNTIGKDGERPAFRIIIGTQVLEQSLDIDFDLLITELAPIDLLLQRIGRLHRHMLDNRPENLKTPLCLILDADDNSRKIYGDYLLIRTRARLASQGGLITIPADVASLVNDVYSEKDLDIAEPERYEAAREAHTKRIAVKKDRASKFLLKAPLNSSRREKTILGMLDTDISDNENSGVAAVRDTDASIEVIVVEDSDKMDRSVCPDLKSALELAGRTIRLPRSLCGSWAIDNTIAELERQNDEKCPEWEASPILKGELFIFLDENGETEINGRRLHYDKDYGLEDFKIG
jgi:CRISPR-associated endonuclease/helicase Cas3